MTPKLYKTWLSLLTYSRQHTFLFKLTHFPDACSPGRNVVGNIVAGSMQAMKARQCPPEGKWPQPEYQHGLQFAWGGGCYAA